MLCIVKRNGGLSRSSACREALVFSMNSTLIVGVDLELVWDYAGRVRIAGLRLGQLYLP